MKKVIIYIVVGIAVLVAGFFLLNNYIYTQKQGDQGFQKDYKNISYVIQGQTVTLVNGYSEVEAAPGSASKIVTKYFGNEAEGDVNGDGVSDISFLITQQTGGSGTFYYLVSAIKTDDGYKGTDAAFLGDRIAPQTTSINNGEILVNYADRKSGEPMTAEPTVGISRYYKVEGAKLVEQMDTAEFSKPVTFVVNQKVKFPDGLTVMLLKIEDSRCKPNVVCIWEGELSAVFSLNGVGLWHGPDEVRLGTSRDTALIIDNYAFQLKAATETTATIIVTTKIDLPTQCYVGGCSSQICSDQKDVVSTCEYTATYACYKTAKCERQTNGKCGWTQTAELTKCLAGAQ